MFRGLETDFHEIDGSPSAIFNQDSKKVGHVLLESLASRENQVFPGARECKNLNDCAMFCGSAGDWLKGFARFSNFELGPCDWSKRFLVEDHSRNFGFDFQTFWIGDFQGFIFHIGGKIRVFITSKGFSGGAIDCYPKVIDKSPLVGVKAKVSAVGATTHFVRETGRISKGLLPQTWEIRTELTRNLYFSVSGRVSVLLPDLPSSSLDTSMITRNGRKSGLPVATPSAFVKKAAAATPKTNKQIKREVKKLIQQELARSTLKAKRKEQAKTVVHSESEEDFTGFNMSSEEVVVNSQAGNSKEADAREIEPSIDDAIKTMSFADALTRDKDGMTADWGDPEVNQQVPVTVEESEEEQDEEESVLQMFGVGDTLKFRIAALLDDKVLTMEVDDDTEVTIEDKDLQIVKDLNKTTITRFMLKAVCDEEFMAERPTQDIVDDFLFFSDGLGLPPEMVPQKAVLLNKDGKEKTVNGKTYPTGQKQLWELQVTTWMELNLNMVCGKKRFSLGSGKDRWTIYTPGEFKNEEPSYYAFGVCKDPTITNVQIARQLKSQGYEIHQDLKGVKDSPKQSFDTSKSGGKYFFLKTEITKKEDGEYNKINIAVYSNNLKRKVQITFTVRDKREKSKKEAQEEQAKKCRACGNEKEKCTGVEEVHCSWKDVNLIEWVAKKKEQFKEIKPFVKNAVVTPPTATTGAEFKVKRYLTKLSEDTNEERVIRIRSLLAHNVKMEAERRRDGAKKNMDEVGFIKVERKNGQQRVLKRTIHKPFKMADFRNVANFTGQFGNKDKIIATLYKWPTRNYEGSRIKALTAELQLRQLAELVTKCGAKENKSSTAIEKVESLQDDEKKKVTYASWIDAHVQALETMICVPE